MKKTYLALTIALIALNGCKDDKKNDVQSPSAVAPVVQSGPQIDGLADKSWDFLQNSVYTPSSLHHWKFDSEVSKTGDTSKAKLILPAHQLLLSKDPSMSTSADEKSLLSAPEFEINVTALDSTTAQFNSALHLETYKVNMQTDETKIELSGQMNVKYDVDLEKQQFKMFENQFDLISATISSESSEGTGKNRITLTNGQEHYEISRNDMNATITAKGSVAKYTTNSQINNSNFTLSEESETTGFNWNLNWAGLSNELVDSKKITHCFTELKASLQNDNATQLAGQCYLDLIKNAQLGDFSFSMKFPEIKDTLQLVNSTSDESIEGADVATPASATDTVVFAAKDSFFDLSFVEKDGFVSLKNGFALNNINISYDLNSYDIPESYDGAITAYLPTMISYTLDLSGFNRDALNQLSRENIAMNGFKLDGALVAFDFDYATAVGGLSVKFSYKEPTQEEFDKSGVTNPLSPQALFVRLENIKLLIQIKNMDELTAPILNMDPMFGLFVSAIKGMGSVSTQDPTVMTYDITWDNQGKSLVNGNPLPF